MELSLRFIEKLLIGDGCWEYQGTPSLKYGSFRVGKKKIAAHRFSYELFNGPIPDGLDVLHHCDNTRCARPSHLFTGTPQDNSDDMVNKRRSCWGPRNCRAKLNDDVIRQIRNSPLNTYEEAYKWGVTSATISKIRLHQTWKHVK